MSFTRTLLAAALLTAMGSAFAEKTISITDPISTAAELEQFNENLDSESTTVTTQNTTAFVFQSGMTNTAVTGSGNLTFEFSGHPENNGGAAVRAQVDASFSGFDELTFKGMDEDQDYYLVFDGGDITFGSAEKALQKLSFENAQLGAFKTENRADIYAVDLSMSEQLNATVFDITVHDVGTKATQNRFFENGIAVGNNHQATIEGGKITVKSNSVANALNSVSGGKIVLKGDQITVESSALDNSHRAISAGSDSSISLEASTTNVVGSVLMQGGSLTVHSTEKTDVTGYVYNNGGKLDMTSKVIHIETPEENQFNPYYNGFLSSGTSSIKAEEFDVIGTLNITGGTTTVNAVETTLTNASRSITVSNGAQLTFTDTKSDQQSLHISEGGVLVSNNEASTASVFSVLGGSVLSDGTVQSNGGTINFGTQESSLSSVVIQKAGNTDGSVLRSNGGNVGVNANSVTISNHGKVAIDAFTYQRTGESDKGSLNVYAAQSLTIDGDIVAGVDSNDYLNSDQGVIRENSEITISSGGTTQITGNIRTYNDESYTVTSSVGNTTTNTEKKGPTSNVINLSLSGQNSWLNGSIVDEGSSSAQNAGTSLSLADNAVWSNTADSTLSKLSLKSGVIDATAGSINVGEVEGQGQITLKGSVDENGQLATTSFTAEKAGANAHLDATYAGITADDVVGRTLDGVSGVATTSYVAQGDLWGAYQQETDSTGKVVSQSYEANTKLDAFRGITASSLVQWRNQINHLTKRLGDVRQQEGSIGTWARVYGGEYKWGSANRVDMQSTTVQVGADARVGDWIVGGAFSYTDSSFDIDNGSSSGDMYSIAAYGSKLFENGAYVDVVARYGYIKNEISAENMDIDVKSNAFSISAETGHQFRFLQQAYVEPQVEIAYGYVQGDDSTASNGVTIDQDDYQSLAARVGFRTGFDFPENAGTIYAHASYSYDFLGEADAVAAKGHARPVKLDEDLGGGWVTYGIGGQFRLGKTTFAYGDLERTTGGDVENPWAFNIGIRHLF